MVGLKKFKTICLKHLQRHTKEGDAERDQNRAEHEAAADILQTGGNEFRDESGNPEPLYVAGEIHRIQ